MPSLQPYNQMLGLRKAKHLLRRTSFNYSKEKIKYFATLTPEKAVEQLVKPQNNAWNEPYDPLPTSNPDGYWISSSEPPNSFKGQGRKRGIVTSWWWYNAMTQTSLHHKLSFFLHTCFTVSKDNGSGASAHFFDHMRLLDFYSYGNLKTLAKKITFDNSMLNYLDNTKNNANNPNENYAREFLELFTILKGAQAGAGDYSTFTELDVQQAARVFSGVKVKSDRTVIDTDTNLPQGKIDPKKHDKAQKQFSERFDNQMIEGGTTEESIIKELDDFVEMIFSKEATAISYCRKLYRFFVKSEWDDEVEQNIIVPLAMDLKANDYELLPIVKKLLVSKHFFDEDDDNSKDETIGSSIKSPLELISETVSFLDLPIPNPNTDALNYYKFFTFVHSSYLASTSLNLWAPDSVAGYPPYYQEPDYDRHWFSSNTVLGRYKLIECLITGKNKIRNNSNLKTKLNLPLFVKNQIENAADPKGLVTELSEYLYPESISPQRVDYFAENLLEGFPDYYWTNEWNNYLNGANESVVKARLDALITQMINAPEFQLK